MKKKIFDKIQRIFVYIRIFFVIILIFLIPIKFFPSLLTDKFSMISYFIILSGCLMNASVIAINRFKMPVLLEEWEKRKKPTHKHSYYRREDKKNIKLWVLSDILPLKIFLKGSITIYKFSIGDVFLVLGVILSFINLFPFKYF